MPLKVAHSPGHGVEIETIPAMLNDAASAFAAARTSLSDPGLVNITTPETAPIPVQVHPIGFQFALARIAKIVFARLSVSGTPPPVTKMSIGVPANCFNATVMFWASADDTERPANLSSIFNRARRSCSAFKFASAVRLCRSAVWFSRVVARSLAFAPAACAVAIFSSAYRSLIAEAQNKDIVETAVRMAPRLAPHTQGYRLCSRVLWTRPKWTYRYGSC